MSMSQSSIGVLQSERVDMTVSYHKKKQMFLCISCYSDSIHLNNTYKAIRVIGKDYNLYYSVWCHGEHELYDLKVNRLAQTDDMI
jgi:hypothetical protein